MKPTLLVEAMAVHNDSGLGRHVRLFVDSLATLKDEVDITVLLPRNLDYKPPLGIQVIYVSGKLYRFFCEVIWPIFIALRKPDVVLCLGQSLPYFRPQSQYVLLVPDVAPLEDLPFLGSGFQKFNRRWMQQRLPKANLIITSAEFTRRRLFSLLHIPQEQVALVAPVPGRSGEDGVSGNEVAPEGPYLLSIGNVEPRKGYTNLLKAYAMAAKRISDFPPLHILGHVAWDGGEAQHCCEELGLNSRVTFHGHVSESKRKVFLKQCTAYVSSSLYEGFGLPLFEALRAGKACVYHGGSAQAEYAAGFALSADCSKPEAFAEILELLWRDGGMRKELERRAMRDFQSRWDAYHSGDALKKALSPLLIKGSKSR